jgi:signal transduction histidine kinase
LNIYSENVRTILPLGVLANPLYNSPNIMKYKDPIQTQLNEFTRLAKIRWAAWITISDGRWIIPANCNLNRASQDRLLELIATSPVSQWVEEKLSDAKIHYRNIESDARVDSKRVYLFPMKVARNAILVGADVLSPQSVRIWKLAANTLSDLLISENLTQQLQDAQQELENIQQELHAHITAQQAAESKLIQTTKLAAVGEMAAGVAHELNNPLTTVVGFSELVLDSLPSDAPQKSDLEVVLREARRARDVVRRLLDFSRQSETIRIRADVNEIVQDVLALMQHLFQINGITIETGFESHLPWVMIDRNQMKQVFLNLFHNALNAMPDGGILNVSSGLQMRYGQSHVCIAIKDTGIGISPDNLPRIFEPFFTTRADSGGTGLGLSVTYGIVTEHGGSIEVESTQSEGSTFKVFLPVEEIP